jgi:hypothetical protein
MEGRGSFLAGLGSLGSERWRSWRTRTGGKDERLDHVGLDRGRRRTAPASLVGLAAVFEEVLPVAGVSPIFGFHCVTATTQRRTPDSRPLPLPERPGWTPRALLATCHSARVTIGSCASGLTICWPAPCRATRVEATAGDPVCARLCRRWPQCSLSQGGRTVDDFDATATDLLDLVAPQRPRCGAAASGSKLVTTTTRIAA